MLLVHEHRTYIVFEFCITSCAFYFVTGFYKNIKNWDLNAPLLYPSLQVALTSHLKNMHLNIAGLALAVSLARAILYRYMW